LEKLGLSESQWEQVRAIRKDNPEPMSREDRKACHQKILAVLTPEQREKLKSLRQSHQNGQVPPGQK
jgi:Spy/CpxP family protein refolding chaperone